MFKGGKPAGRYIPGASIPGAPASSAQHGDGNKKKKNNKKKGKGEGENGAVPSGPAAPVDEMAKANLNGAVPASPATPDDAAAKKIRNVEKKVSRGLTCIRRLIADGVLAQKY